MDSGLINALIAGGFATILVAIINAVTQRRKLGADATKVITDAAANITANSRKDNDQLRIENQESRKRERELDRRVEELEDSERSWQRERREWRQILQVHAAWDFEAITALRGGTPPIEMRVAPPLTPDNLPLKGAE